MKNHSSGCEVVHKDVVIIGNGPSGISLSAMLSGLLPHVISFDHPDEMLSARLHLAPAQLQQLSLAQQQALLEELAVGLEGRTTNPVSLLLDALEHPCADLGIEMPALIQWRKHSDKEIDHVVLGKGPPGGSWHTMDPNILTLSLASWMALPGLPYLTETSDSQRRAAAGSVAQYYQQYVTEMHLEQYFNSGVHVIKIEEINLGNKKTPVDSTVLLQKTNKDVCDTVLLDANNRRKCSLINAFNFIRSRTKCHKQKPKETVNRCCKRSRELLNKIDQLTTPNRKRMDRSFYSVDLARISRESIDTANDDIFNCDMYLYSKTKSKAICNSPSHKIRSLSFSCDSDYEKNGALQYNDDLKQLVSIDNQKQHNSLMNICQCFHTDTDPEIADNTDTAKARWLVTAYNSFTNQQIVYSCNNLVLANGASDLPNRLGLPAETFDLPWVLHDLRRLEDKLDEFRRGVAGTPDPVLIIGAGLSAADAVIATRFRNIPVLHVFRNKSVSLDKQLPENMYPEYHKVHQMMLDGGSTYPLYTALPEYSVTNISAGDKTVTITSKDGVQTCYKVSFVVILIGSRPNLSFLPGESSLGVNPSYPVDAKQNPIDINRLSHGVNGHEGLYAIGPLAGDHFVRFIPGGALAVVSDLYKRKSW